MTDKNNNIPKPVVLCILDGWGCRDEEKDNAIYKANKPCWDELISKYPNSKLETSGLFVGLPKGQMGNSEVGHMNIGSGRVVLQSLPKIDDAIEKGDLAGSSLIKNLSDKLLKTGGVCHIMGLLSPGGVHADQRHIAKLAKIVAAQGIKVKIHAFTDGRDTPPESACEYLDDFAKDISGDFEQSISIATVSGRYYAMDRDQRWERVKLAYDAIVNGFGEKVDSAKQAVDKSYAEDKTDEFIKPSVVGGYQGIKDGDALIMANFRADRAREILQAILFKDFEGFDRGNKSNLKLVKTIGMVEYSEAHNNYLETLFPPEKLSNILGQVIADNNLRQLRIAETEKYAHVTFFFNAGKEEEFRGEERILIPSPKVATYDEKPEMAAFEVTEKLTEAIESKKFDLIVVNYANTDMVGHTGIEEAAIEAVEAVDKCLSKVVEAIKKTKGVVLITADHGNAEMMVDDKGNPHTSHTTGPVPFVVAGDEGVIRDIKPKNGKLCDIAPSILKLMSISQPKEMTGESLV